MALVTRVRRAWNAFRQPPKPVVHEKQFVFMWRDTDSRQVQWHLIDYETYTKEGYNTNALAHMAIKYKTDSLALVSLRGYTGDVDNPDILPPDNELSMLLDRPNGYQSQFEFMQLADTYYNIDGNAFIYMRRDNGVDNLPTSLHVLRPDRVYIKPIQIRGLGDILFLYVPEGKTYSDGGIPILQRDMMHIKTPNPYDPLEGMGYGLPGLMPVSRDVDMDNMMTQFLFNIFDHQGIMPGGYIETPYEMDEDDIAMLRQQFQESEGGYKNWGRPIVLDQSQVYRPSAFTLDQLDVQALDKRQIKRILGVFGVPGKLIGMDDDASTFSNVAEAREEFWTRTMLSELKAFEDEFKFRLRVEGQDWFCGFDTTDVPALQQDLRDASEIYSMLVEHGVPPNEAARRVDLQIPMIVGGDVPLILGSLIPLQRALEPPTPAANPFQQAPNDDESEGDIGDDGNDMEDVPVEDDEKTFKASRWDFDSKQAIWKALDSVTESWESRFQTATETAFLNDLEAINTIIKNSKGVKAVIEWGVARRGINLYLSTTGAQMWRTTFAPVIIGLTEAQTERWIQRAPDMFPPGTFSLRNVQAEAWFNRHLLTFATAINDTTRNDIHRILSDGLEHGLSNDRLADSLEQLFVQYMQGDVDPNVFAFLQDRLPSYRREMIARTETHGAMSAGNHALYQSAGVQRKEWLATRDSRTRDTHLQAWNKYSEGGTPGPIPIEQDFIVGGFHMSYPGDRSAPIGEWVNCFIPDTQVSGNFVAGSKVWYSGAVRQIKTGRGNTLTVTPNHPILTNRGWVSAHELKEGDYLLSYSNEVRSGVHGDVNHQYSPSAIKDVFNSIATNGRKILSMVRTLDFDGDGEFCTGQIDIVGMNGVLPLQLQGKHSLKDNLQFEFIPSSDIARLLVISDSTPDLSFNSIRTAPTSVPSVVHLGNDPIGVLLDALPFDTFRVGLASEFYTTLGKESRNNASVVPQFLTELVDASAGQIAFDNIIGIVEYDFSGHVYDLQAIDSWILAENIVTGNCRCVELPFIPE